MKILIQLLLEFTWKSNLGTRLKYKLKKSNYNFKKLGWSIKLYNTNDSVLKKRWNELIFFNWNSFKKNNHINGIADPFLISIDRDIFMFYELIHRNKGEIWVSKIDDKKNKIIDSNKIIDEKYHLSYPNVIKDGKYIYMVPESSEGNVVNLYKSIDFPYSWKLEKTLKEASKFVDTNLLVKDGIYYWFTFDSIIKKGRLFYSKGLKETWVEHKSSPYESGRNAGSFIINKGAIYRPVQLKGKTYGEGFGFRKLIEISMDNFLEIEYKNPFLEKDKEFSLDGTHHLSILKQINGYLIAVDGKNNNFFRVLYKKYK